MKPLYTCLLFIVFSYSASAQMKWRLVGFIDYGYRGEVNYTEYKYSKKRGGIIPYYDNNYISTLQNKAQVFQYEFPWLEYDEEIKHFGTMEWYEQVFDQDEKVIVRLHHYDSSAKVRAKDSFFYDNRGNLLHKKTYRDRLVSGQWMFRHVNSYFYEFDNNNRIIRETYADYYSSPDTVYTKTDHIYTYGINGELLKDSLTIWGYNYQTNKFTEHPSRVYVYDYDGGLLKHKDEYGINVNGLYLIKRLVHHYDAFSRLVNDSTYSYSGSNSSFEWANTYTYDNSGRLIKKYYEAPPKPNFRTVRVIHHKYNSAGLLIENRDSTLQSSTGPFYTRREYFYDQCWPNDILPPYRQGPEENIYPNPAKGIVYIHADWEEEGIVNGVVRDMQGSEVMHWREQSSEIYDKQLNIHQLASGVYILQLRNNNQTITRQFIVL